MAQLTNEAVITHLRAQQIRIENIKMIAGSGKPLGDDIPPDIKAGVALIQKGGKVTTAWLDKQDILNSTI